MSPRPADPKPPSAEDDDVKSIKPSDIDAALKKAAPSLLMPYIEKYGPKVYPVISAAADVVDALAPYAEKAFDAGCRAYGWSKANHMEDLLPMLVGLIYIFFGGYFVMTMASVEAFRLTGYPMCKTSLKVLWQDYQIIREASHKDDLVDEDHDGIADVKEISKKALMSRKITLFMKSVNPVELSMALSGVYAGLVAVVAALQLEFARTVAFGATIGEVLAEPIVKCSRPGLKKVVPEVYHKWIEIGINYACKSIAIAIAMFITRVLSSAVRGGYMFVKGLARFCEKRGVVHFTASYYDEAMAVLVCVVGFVWQLSNMYELPFLLKLLLCPAVLFENTMTYIVHLSGNGGTLTQS